MLPIQTIQRENAEFQIIEALKNNRQKRNKLGELFIEGTESIKQAETAGTLFTRFLTELGRPLSSWAKDLIHHYPTVKWIELDSRLYSRLSDRDNPSELSVTAEIPQSSLEQIDSEQPFVLVFDRPSDYGNFGTIVRSANSFNVDALLVLGHGVDVYDPRVIRSSLGSIFHTPVIKLESMKQLEQWVSTQKEHNGLTLVGTDSTGEMPLNHRTLKRPVALVLGNEAKGISQALQELCDCMVRIPLAGEVNSLNVSCAGSILLWEIFKAGL